MDIYMMGELQATVEFSVEIHKFYNVDLFQRGFYQIRVAPKLSPKCTMRMEVCLPRNLRRTIKPSSQLIFPACVVNGTAVSRTFKILYKNDEITLDDVAIFKIHIVIDSHKIEDSLNRADFQLNVELWFTEHDFGPEHHSSIQCVSSRLLNIHLSPTKGLHHHVPILFDYFHLSAVTISIHGRLLSLHEPYIDGNVVRPSWLTSTPRTPNRFQTTSFDSVLFGNTMVRSSPSLSRLSHVRCVHHQICSILLSSYESLQGKFQEYVKLLPPWQQIDLELTDCYTKLNHLSEVAKTMEAEDELLAVVNSDIAQLCAENIILWQQFLEAFTLKDRVRQHLAREHHLQRVKRFAEGFFVAERSRQSMLACADIIYATNLAVSEKIRKTKYFALLPFLSVECAEVDGTADSLPIIFEDQYQFSWKGQTAAACENGTVTSGTVAPLAVSDVHLAVSSDGNEETEDDGKSMDDPPLNGLTLTPLEGSSEDRTPTATPPPTDCPENVDAKGRETLIKEKVEMLLRSLDGCKQKLREQKDCHRRSASDGNFAFPRITPSRPKWKAFKTAKKLPDDSVALTRLCKIEGTPLRECSSPLKHSQSSPAFSASQWYISPRCSISDVHVEVECSRVSLRGDNKDSDVPSKSHSLESKDMAKDLVSLVPAVCCDDLESTPTCEEEKHIYEEIHLPPEEFRDPPSQRIPIESMLILPAVHSSREARKNRRKSMNRCGVVPSEDELMPQVHIPPPPPPASMQRVSVPSTPNPPVSDVPPPSTRCPVADPWEPVSAEEARRKAHEEVSQKLVSLIGCQTIRDWIHGMDHPCPSYVKAKEEFKRQLDLPALLYSDTPILASTIPYFHVSEEYRYATGEGLHLVVCVHGLDGNSADLRLVKTYLELGLPGSNLEFLMSERNQGDTFSDFEKMTDKLVAEILSHIQMFRLSPMKISFIGHSLGNIIIRSALARPEMKPLLSTLHTFLSLSGPHLGTMYNSSGLVNMGMWFMQKWKKSGSLLQLSLRDASDIRQSFLYELSKKSGLQYFKNVLLFGSSQDRYVPIHSARIELCKAAVKDSSLQGIAYREMVHNLLDPVLKRPDLNFVRYDVHHALPNTANSLIGRAAHIAVLDSELFIEKFLTVCGLKYFE